MVEPYCDRSKKPPDIVLDILPAKLKSTFEKFLETVMILVFMFLLFIPDDRAISLTESIFQNPGDFKNALVDWIRDNPDCLQLAYEGDTLAELSYILKILQLKKLILDHLIMKPGVC